MSAAFNGGMMLAESKNPPPIPREIVRTAKNMFGHRNFYIQVGDALDGILSEHAFGSSTDATLDPTFVLITLFQAVEGLTDLQAINAVHTRVDWKYALHLPVHSPVMQEESLCEFRCRLFGSSSLSSNFLELANQFLTLKLSSNNRFQELGKEDVLPAVCLVNSIAAVQDAIRRTLEELAVRYPEWLKKIVLPQWYRRYSGFSPLPLGGNEQTMMEAGIADMGYLLQQIHRSDIPELKELGEIKELDQLWSQHFQQQSKRPDENQSLQSQHCKSCPTRAAIRGRKL